MSCVSIYCVVILCSNIYLIQLNVRGRVAVIELCKHPLELGFVQVVVCALIEADDGVCVYMYYVYMYYEIMCTYVCLYIHTYIELSFVQVVVCALIEADDGVCVYMYYVYMY